jgi:hypothetical protein
MASPPVVGWTDREREFASRYIEAGLYRKLPLVKAVRDAVEGNPHRLATLIRFGWPLSYRDRKCLADYIEGKFQRGRGRPRLRPGKPRTPADRLSRAIKETVAQVRGTKRELKQRGLGYGLHDVIIDFVLEKRAETGLKVPSRSSVESELRRSKQSRK